MWGEFLGIGFAASVAVLHNNWIGEPRSLGEHLLLIIWMLFAGAVEGSLLGWFQSRVLRRHLPQFRAGTWIRLTMLAGITAWLIGMLPSTLVSMQQGPAGAPSSQPSFLVMAAMVIGGGLLLGGMFGAFQGVELSKHISKGSRWVWANAIGWSLGLGWIFAGATWPNESTPWYWIVSSAILGGLLAGLTVGLVTGRFLLRIMAEDSGKKPSFSPNLS